MQPSISYVMAAHDAAPWIEAAIASALAQEGVDVEVIVVDDASRDNTARCVLNLAEQDERIKLIRRSKSGGPATARNEALDRARGTWIGVLDADDLIEPDRSRRLIDLAEGAKCCVAADDAVRFRDGAPDATWSTLPEAGTERPFRVGLSAYLDRNRLTGGESNLGYLKPIFARDFLQRHGIRYDERLRIGEDFNIVLRCLAAGTDLAVLPLPLYRYRVAATSLSRQLTAHDLRVLRSAHEQILSEACRDTPTRRAGTAFTRSISELDAYVAFRAALRAHDWRRVLGNLVHPGLCWTIAHVSARAALRASLRKRHLPARRTQ